MGLTCPNSESTSKELIEKMSRINRHASPVTRLDKTSTGMRKAGTGTLMCGKFKQALPYFTKAKSIKDEPELAENLTNTQNTMLSRRYEKLRRRMAQTTLICPSRGKQKDVLSYLVRLLRNSPQATNLSLSSL